MSRVTTDKLLEDLRLVIHDAEELLKATAGQAGEHIAEVRARAEASIRAAREQLSDFGFGGARAREVAGSADAYAHEHPWLALGAGAAVGLLLGLLVGHRPGRVD